MALDITESVWVDIAACHVINNRGILRYRLGFPFDKEDSFVAERTRPVSVNL